MAENENRIVLKTDYYLDNFRYLLDFVLKDYGSGAVVGVPGHDERDFEFAQVFDLPVIRVVEKDGDKSEIKSTDQVLVDEGMTINSDFLNGLTTNDAMEKIMDYLEEKQRRIFLISFIHQIFYGERRVIPLI